MDGTTFSMYLQGATLLNNTFPGASALASFGLEIRKTLDHFISRPRCNWQLIGNTGGKMPGNLIYGIFMNL
jgi:hypothetical protein